MAPGIQCQGTWEPRRRGYLEPNEFKAALKELPSGRGLGEEELEHLARYVDFNGQPVADIFVGA